MSSDSDAAGARRGARSRLMRLAQQGDREAYRTLLEDIEPYLHAFLRRRLADASDVGDVVQETLLRVHQARHTYDPSRPIEPWLLAIARNVATDHLRLRLARRTWEVPIDSPLEAAATPDAPREIALETMLEKLPPRQREAFELIQLEGLSVRAAAARVGTTPGALKVRAHRAYRALKRLLGG
jgi:RNA polymerase sigma-70 factor (ECF subfamily)